MTAQQWLASKATLMGPFIRIPRPEIVEILGLAGFDYAVVDLEHGPITPAELYPMVLAAERRGLKLIARLPGLQESYFKWVLDLDLAGIQVPHVQTKADAEAAVHHARFAPEGLRGLCRFVRAAEFSNISGAEHMARANANKVLVLQIEGKEGAANVEAIASVPGVDVIFVGPYDLSQSLGVPGDIWNPKVIDAVTRIVSFCATKGIAVGVFTDTPAGVKHWRGLGVKYITYRIDVELLLSHLKSHLAELKAQT